MKRMQLWGAVLVTTCLASVAFAADCGAEARALMPSNGQLAAMCPGEPLFNKAPSVMGSKTMCHYDYGAPGAAGMMVSKLPAKSAKETAESDAKMGAPGYQTSVTKLPYKGVEGYAFSMSKGPMVLSSAYYVDSKAGVLKIEFWMMDKKKLDGCLEGVIRAVLAKAK
jgi:hypothetical protein